MADKEFTQICKEILGIGKRLEKIEPDELRKIKTDIEKISELVAANKTLFDTDKKDFDGKYNKIVEIIKTFDTLKAQIEEVLKNGTINDSAEALISTFSSKKIMDLLNEAKRVMDEKFSTIHKNGINPWSPSLEYPAGAISVLNGKLYQAKTQNINKKPSENKEIWSAFASKEWSEQTFLNKDDKIDAYSKTESDDKFVLKIELQKAIPTGAYVLYSSNSNTPDGFLRCDGSALDKTAYAALFAVIGYTYGRNGDKFLLPNFSDGKFMRGTGGNAAALGTAQQDAIRNITGKFQTSAEEFYSETNPNTKNHRGWGAFQRYDAQGSRPTVTTVGKNLAYDFDASRVVPTANENRPLNMAVVVLIKY
nr:MAG TPA: Baseplate wedge protein [Caudoviricetes sp.]